jgi:hypothetical protein
MTDIEKLQKLTGETDTELLNVLLEDAETFVLEYTGRTEMKPQLKKAARDLAVIALNRIGTEGESSRSEAGESYSFNDLPVSIERVLNRYRLARIGGRTHEYTEE